MSDTPASKPTGRYYFTAGGGFYPDDHLQGVKDVYASRWRQLASMGLQFQVLIMSHGELCWINADPEGVKSC
jgi:hypothetical protein